MEDWLNELKYTYTTDNYAAIKKSKEYLYELIVIL